MEKKTKKIYNLQEAKLKIEQYCIYQDRCFKEVETKLRAYGLLPESIDFILEDLIKDNFINEERYCKSFVRGAYRYKKWGRKKISQALKQKDITKKCIEIGFREIDENEYFEMIQKEIVKKTSTINEKNTYKKKQKIIRFALSRGYEYQIIEEIISTILDE